jgi:hypothetical protein
LNAFQESLKPQEGLQRTDRIEAALEADTFVADRHPLRNRHPPPLNLDLEIGDTPITNPPHYPKLVPKKRMKWVLNPYNALVTGIIC